MADVFVSYAREDLSRARDISSSLESSGLSVWIDLEGIEPAADWMRAIRAAIDECAAFVFLISVESIRSSICLQELQHANATGKKIVPVLLEAVTEPEIPEELGSLQWIEAIHSTDLTSAIESIVHATQSDPTWTTLHARLTVRAREWKEHDHASSRLMRGDELATAENELTIERTANQPQASEIQRQYVQASRKAATSRLRKMIGAITFAAMLTLAAAVIAIVQMNRAQLQARMATSRALAASAKVEMENQFELSMLLAVAAHEIKPTPEAYGSLLSVLSRQSDLISARRDVAVNAIELLTKDGALISIGPDVIQELDTASLSVLNSHELAPFLEDGESGAWILVTPDLTIGLFGTVRRDDQSKLDSRVVAVDLGTSAVIWEKTTSRDAVAFPGRSGDTILLVDTLDYKANPMEIHLKTGKARTISWPNDLRAFGYGTAYSRFRIFLADGSDDSIEVKVIDPESYRSLNSIKPVIAGNPSFGAEQQLWVNKIAHSSATGKLAIGLSDGTVSVASQSDSKAKGDGRPAHSANLKDLEFSSSGRFIASIGEDGSLAIWSIKKNELYLLDRRKPINGWRASSVAFSSDETRIYVSTERGLLVRSTLPGPGLLGRIVSVAQNHWVAPDASQFARNDDASPRAIDIVDTSTLSRVRRFTDLPGFPVLISFNAGAGVTAVVTDKTGLQIGRISFADETETIWRRIDTERGSRPILSTDNQLIAIDPGNVELFDIQTGKRRSQFEFVEGWSAKHSFSPKSTWITAMTEGHFGDELYVWPTTSASGGRDEAATLYPVRGWTFDAAESRLVVSRSEGVDIYPLQDGFELGEPKQLSAQSDVEILGFAANESLLIGAGSFLHIWSLEAGQPITDSLPVTWPDRGCYWRELAGTCQLAYSADATRIAVVIPNIHFLPKGYMKGVRLARYTTPSILILWELDPDTLKATACRVADRELTQDEWLRFAPEFLGSPVCRGGD